MDIKEEYVIDKKEGMIINTGSIIEGYGYTPRPWENIKIIMTNDNKCINILRQIQSTLFEENDNDDWLYDEIETVNILNNKVEKENPQYDNIDDIIFKLENDNCSFEIFINNSENVPYFKQFIELSSVNNSIDIICYDRNKFMTKFRKEFVLSLLDENDDETGFRHIQIDSNARIDDIWSELDYDSEESCYDDYDGFHCSHDYKNPYHISHYKHMDKVEMLMDNYFEGLFKYKDSYIFTDVCKEYGTVYKLKILKTLNKDEYEKRHKNCMNILHDIEELLVMYGYYGIGDTIKLCMDYEKTPNIILNEDINVTDNYFLYIGDSIKFDINDIQEIIIDRGIIEIENENTSVEIKIFEEE